MGQVHLTSLNKTGIFMYWSSLWEDKINYTRLLKEDFLIKKTLHPLIWDSFVNRHYFMDSIIQKQSNLFTSKLCEYYENDDSQKINEFFYFLKNSEKRLPYYFTKIWIIRYHKWLIISIGFFKPYRKLFDYLNIDYSTVLNIKTNLNKTKQLNVMDVNYFLYKNNYKNIIIYKNKLKIHRYFF